MKKLWKLLKSFHSKFKIPLSDSAKTVHLIENQGINWKSKTFIYRTLKIFFIYKLQVA